MPPADGLASRLVAGTALRAQPDRRLVTLVRDGYEAAFEEIVRRYGRPLGRYAAGIVGARSEDVTQDAFSKALLALRREGSEIELRPWLYRIVRNTALNDLHDSPPAPEALAESIAGGRSAAEVAEERERLAELIGRLRALPESQRAAIVMRELEGLSHEEIAAALGLSGGAARQAIHRARTALRDGLGLLVPLPIMRALIENAPEATAAGVGASAGIGGALGLGSGAMKAGAVAAVIAGSVGTGIALHDDRDGGRRQVGDPEPRSAALSRPAGALPAAGDPTLVGSSGDGEEAGDDSGPGGGDSGHHGRGDDDPRDPDEESNSGPGDGDETEGRSGPSGSSEDGDDDSGSGSSGSSSGPSGDDFEVDSSGSGSGTSGSGSSGSGSGDGSSGSSGSGSGSGSSGPGSGTLSVAAVEEDSSGPGGESDDSSGSGSGED